MHDLVGKQLGRPAYQLLGGACREAIRPYATIYPGVPGGRTIGELMDDIAAASSARSSSASARSRWRRSSATSSAIASSSAAFRKAGGWSATTRRCSSTSATAGRDWRAALWTLNRLEDCDLYLAEATLQHDDLDGHAKLAARAETRIGGAEMAATRFECREWIEHGRVDVLQPDVNRAGGLTEMARIAQLAEDRGVLVVPHGWKTGITAAAARHFQAATPNVPSSSTSPPTSSTRRCGESSSRRAAVVDGAIELPTAPGLGIELDARGRALPRLGHGHGQP